MGVTTKVIVIKRAKDREIPGKNKGDLDRGDIFFITPALT